MTSLGGTDGVGSRRPRPPLHIALLTPRFSPYVGGLETHVGRLAAELVRRGHAVEVFTQRTDEVSPAQESMNGVRVRRCDGLFGRVTYSLPLGLRRALAGDGRSLDVLHAHGYHSVAALSAVGSGHRGMPLIFTPHYHGTGHTAPARAAHVVYRPFGRQLFCQATRIICVSASEAELVFRDFGAQAAARTVVIPNGVDDAALLEATPYDVRHDIVLSVGRLVEYKNLEVLVSAARTLPATARVVIVGDGPDRGRLEDRAARSGVADRVTFLGHVSDAELARWYRTATVAVEISRHEAFGIVLLEALVAGARVLASDIPAHRRVAELVGAREVTFIATDASAHELSLQVAHALSRGRPASPALSEVPTWPSVAARTEGVYTDALHVAGRRCA
jgi:glycosyltransferase involved in cell wall biosynthesis